jgi:hypothetical protein
MSREIKQGEDGRNIAPNFHLGTRFFSNGIWWVIYMVTYTGGSGWSWEAKPDEGINVQ